MKNKHRSCCASIRLFLKDKLINKTAWLFKNADRTYKCLSMIGIIYELLKGFNKK